MITEAQSTDTKDVIPTLIVAKEFCGTIGKEALDLAIAEIERQAVEIAALRNRFDPQWKDPETERLRVDAERWRTFWSAINGERVTLWTVVGGGPRESVFMSPDLVLEKVDAALREGKTE